MQTLLTPINAFSDNYIWLWQNQENQSCLVVDPGDAQPVLDYIESHALTLKIILVTHHHFDHTGGVEKLSKICNASVYGPVGSPFDGIDYQVKENDKIELPFLNTNLTVLETPGHTLDHIVYFNDELIFCGDTLFSAGCGRVFEGTPAQLFTSLEKICQLPEATQIYPAHEYTLANLQFAKSVEPCNYWIKNYEKQCLHLLSEHKPTLPSVIVNEMKVNPFLRCRENTVQSAVKCQYHLNSKDPSEIFSALRHWKNNFRNYSH